MNEIYEIHVRIVFLDGDVRSVRVGSYLSEARAKEIARAKADEFRSLGEDGSRSLAVVGIDDVSLRLVPVPLQDSFLSSIVLPMTVN